MRFAPAATTSRPRAGSSRPCTGASPRVTASRPPMRASTGGSARRGRRRRSDRRRAMRRVAIVPLLLLTSAAPAAPVGSDAPLRARADAVTFAVIGDSGTGDRVQYDLARQMVAAHGRVPFDLVLMLGDNIYGGQSPADFVQK